MTTFLQYTFNGLVTGAIYVLIGVGLTLGIGVARFFNFAQGQFVVTASFLAATLVEYHVPFLVTLPVVVIALGILGLGLRNVVARFAKDNTLIVFLGTLGFSIVLEYTIVLIWGATTRSVGSPFTGTFQVHGLSFPSSKVFLFAVVFPVVALLYVLLWRTDMGRRLRACAENRAVCSLLGINVARQMGISVIIGSAMAGLAGVLLGILFPFDFTGGTSYLINGIAVTLAGGLGSVTGSVVCGMGLGLVETYATAYGNSAWQNGYAFVLMIIILAWRPRGLFRGTGEL